MNVATKIFITKAFKANAVAFSNRIGFTVVTEISIFNSS